MGTEVALSVNSLRAQLENEKNSLFKIDESIKKIVQTSGRYQNDRFNNSGLDLNRGGPRISRNNSFPDTSNIYKTDDNTSKRKHETKTVFSRLSIRQSGDSDPEDNNPFLKKPRISSQVTRDLPTKQEILKAQCGDEQSKVRNRRMFGSLLGTLQKFKQEEINLKSKEEKKAQIERKIDEQAKQERENRKRERQSLFAERELKKAKIKGLEAKMGRAHEFEKWESGQKSLANFILTKTKPQVYWLPKKMNDKATEKLASSRKYYERYMGIKRQELQEELTRIEQKCIRMAKVPQGYPQRSASKENSGCDIAADSALSTRNKFPSDTCNVKEEPEDTPVKRESDKPEMRHESPREQNGSAPHSPQPAQSSEVVQKDDTMETSDAHNENIDEEPSKSPKTVEAPTNEDGQERNHGLEE